MPTLIEHLRSLNRKERFILLREALGDHTFRLDRAFREKLGGTLRVSIPEDAFVAMDYHLDWIALALYLNSTPTPPERIPKAGALEEVNKSQMDIDLLVAFDAAATTHVVLIEAKGDTSWDNAQLARKAGRLKQMFKEYPKGVEPHFVLLSPTSPQRLTTDCWPDWMKPNGSPLWMPLTWPEGLLKPTRCDVKGRNAAKGKYLRLDPSRGNS